MKKLSLIAFLLLSTVVLHAQHLPKDFFGEHGVVRLETQEMKDDTVVTIFHRADDVIWSRVVYRVIDMRYKQNYQLYFPTRIENEGGTIYKSLFRVILEAMQNGLNVWAKPMQYDMNPHFEREPARKCLIPDLLEIPSDNSQPAAMEDEEMMADDMMMEEAPVEDDGKCHDNLNVMGPMRYYEEGDRLEINKDYYEMFVRNQLKYVIQEVIFFDKHYSRMYSKIVAIAPMYAPKGEGQTEIKESLFQQICFWIPFDELRKHLVVQEVIPMGNNDKTRMSFEQFFAQKRYSSYLIGDSNMYDRMIFESTQDKEEIRKEQQRIQTELLNFEQDLWEY